MNERRLRTITVAAIAVLGLGLAGCSGSSTSGGSDTSAGTLTSQAPAETVAPAPVPAPAPDLSGEWEQSNKNSEDSFQAATITGDTIEINWVSNGGDTMSLYWAGTFVAPTSADPYSWDSANDTTKTSNAMLASPDPTKTFTYDGEVISYKASLMGTTTTVKLKRK